MAMSELENIHGESGHEDRFSDLSALAFSGDLSPTEKSELEAHLAVCPECREAFAEYAALAREGFPSLASVHGNGPSADGVGEEMVESSRRKLFDSLPATAATAK